MSGAYRHLRVLVAGGAGYIGSVLVRQLIDRGHHVTVWDSGVYGFDGLKGIQQAFDAWAYPLLSRYEALDLGHLAGIDAVVNLAGISTDPTADLDPARTIAVNTDAAIALAKAAKASGVRRYILASSCSIYDGVKPSCWPCHPGTRVHPTSTYAVSKREAEKGCMKLNEGWPKFEVTCFRLGTVYGVSPRLRLDLVVNAMVKDALTTGKIQVFDPPAVRAMVHIENAARTIIDRIEGPGDGISNLVDFNVRISSLAGMVRSSLPATAGIKIVYDHDRPPGRTYEARLYPHPLVGRGAWPKFAPAVEELAKVIRDIDTDDPRYYNLRVLTGE